MRLIQMKHEQGTNSNKSHAMNGLKVKNNNKLLQIAIFIRLCTMALEQCDTILTEAMFAYCKIKMSKPSLSSNIISNTRSIKKHFHIFIISKI